MLTNARGEVAEWGRALDWPGDRVVLGSNPAAATSCQNVGNSVYLALPVSFGGDTKRRRSLLSGVYGYATLHDHHLPITDKAKYLGITISNDRKWNKHVSNITSKANSTLGMLSQLEWVPLATRRANTRLCMMYTVH